MPPEEGLKCPDVANPVGSGLSTRLSSALSHIIFIAWLLTIQSLTTFTLPAVQAVTARA